MTMSPTVRRWLGFIAVALGVSLIVVDTTIVNVIIPQLVSDLGASSSQTQWIQEAYPIVLASLLLLTGRLADLFGARRVFLIGVGFFVVASVLAGIAPTGGLVVAARFLQGAGAAMLLPTSLALVNTTFEGAERGRAFAVWGATLGVSGAIGPALGGVLAEVSWRWAFGINVPLGLLIVLGVLAFLKPSPRGEGRVDVLGAVLSVIGFGLLAFALIEGRTYGWITTQRPVNLGALRWESGPSPVLVVLLVAAAALAWFGRYQRRLSRQGATEPLMDVRLFGIQSFRNGNIALLIIGIGEFGIVAVLPLWMQFALGYTPLQAGMALMPMALGTLAASTISMGIMGRVTPLRVVRAGLTLEVAGLVAIGLVASPDQSWWPITFALFFFGIGNGFAAAQIANVILAEVPPESAGRGSAVQSASAQIGSALGIAVLTTSFFTALSVVMSGRLAGLGVAGSEAQRLTDAVTSSAGAVLPMFDADPSIASAAEAGRNAMADSVSVVGYIAAGALALGLVATVLIPSRRVPDASEPPTAGRDVPEQEDHPRSVESGR